MRRRSFRRWWVKAGPEFTVGGRAVFGLTPEQLAEWDQWLTDRRPRAQIYL
jgi:hypothetical protein